MATQQLSPPLKVDRYVVIHVATTCDEHGVYVTRDSAEVIEIGWILLDSTSLEEVSKYIPLLGASWPASITSASDNLHMCVSFIARMSW